MTDTTIQHLGGLNRLRVMINAKNFITSNNCTTLSFKFSGSAFATHVRIALENDLYNLEFMKIRGTNIKHVGKLSGIDCENLKFAFSNFTKLALSL